jgi:hypothetical protein
MKTNSPDPNAIFQLDQMPTVGGDFCEPLADYPGDLTAVIDYVQTNLKDYSYFNRAIDFDEPITGTIRGRHDRNYYENCIWMSPPAGLFVTDPATLDWLKRADYEQTNLMFGQTLADARLRYQYEFIKYRWAPFAYLARPLITHLGAELARVKGVTAQPIRCEVNLFKPGGCIRPHRDRFLGARETWRTHLVLWSNPNARMYGAHYEGTWSAGQCWILQNLQEYWFLNLDSDQTVAHMVIDWLPRPPA